MYLLFEATRVRAGGFQRAGFAMPEWRELSLEEMLLDPIVRAVMAADDVDPDEVRTLARAVTNRSQRADRESVED